jgi:hypothetical protein
MEFRRLKRCRISGFRFRGDEGVACNERPIRRAPKRDVSGRMAGRVNPGSSITIRFTRTKLWDINLPASS